MAVIGIIGAMEEEVSRLKRDMNVTGTVKRAGMLFTEGTLEGKDVVIVRSGIGKVNAAVCTQILADRYNLKAVINTGVAGSLDAKIDIGDIVLSVEAMQHDMDTSMFGDPVGVIPRMKTSVFPADEKLLALAEKVCNEVNPEIHTFRGRVLSGDQAIGDENKKRWLVDTFHGACTEMEGAAIAQAAWLNGVPFLIIRAISDKADGSASMDYGQFEKQAIVHTCKLVKGLLKSADL